MSAPRDTLEPAKKAAIGSDELRESDKNISQISAQEFLKTLDKHGLGASSLTLLPEKKKLELFTEPEWTVAVKVNDLVRALTIEKKKVELEIPVDYGHRFPDPYAFGRNGGPARMAGATQQRAFGGGAAGYPNPDDDNDFPWPVEIRKSMLDSMFDRYVRPALKTHLAGLESAVRGISQRIEQLEKKIG